jgi:hypothetical protein
MWTVRVIVEGDAAYGSQGNMQMVLKRDMEEPARHWGFVSTIARTWKTAEDKAIKDLVTICCVNIICVRGWPVSQASRAAKPSGCIAHACVCATSVMSP